MYIYIYIWIYMCRAWQKCIRILYMYTYLCVDVCACIYIYMCVCARVQMCTNMHAHTQAHTHIHPPPHTQTHIYTDRGGYVHRFHVPTYVYIHLCISMYVCTSIFAYIYRYVFTICNIGSTRWATRQLHHCSRLNNKSHFHCFSFSIVLLMILSFSIWHKVQNLDSTKSILK